MKQYILLLTAGFGISLSATGHAALFHLDQTNFNVYLGRPSAVLDWAAPASGRLTLEEGEIGARPIAFELDGSGGLLPHDYDRGVYFLAGTESLFEGEGEHSFGQGGQEVRHVFQATVFPSAGETRTYRLYAGTSVFEDSENPYDYANDVFVDITFHFRDGVAPPVPEPASMAVLGLGALALLRRKKKA
jgi:hypothetical protein